MAEHLHLLAPLQNHGERMEFIDFARSHGIIINDLPPFGQWVRYPTEDHPKSRNGAVKFLGDHGFVQNHATSTVVAVWKPDSDKHRASDRVQSADWARRQAKAEQDVKQRQADAIKRAVGMLNNSVIQTHPYLVGKGFPDEEGHVYFQGGDPVLLIPMRVGKSLVGVQQIDREGSKRFLYGQKTAGATFTFDNRGVNIVCEGYATALSVRLALKHMKMRYTIHVCFSAGNMVRVAGGLQQGLVIADNDQSGTGQQAAAEIGWPVWMSDVCGEDANDYHQRVGLFGLTQSLTQLMLQVGATRQHEA
jgi:putative DNA primase/helicase